MCEICRQTPCHNMCPNADEPKIIGHCDNVNCGEPLREDYTFFTDNDDNMFCSLNCALAYYGIHEEEYDGK